MIHGPGPKGGSMSSPGEISSSTTILFSTYDYSHQTTLAPWVIALNKKVQCTETPGFRPFTLHFCTVEYFYWPLTIPGNIFFSTPFKAYCPSCTNSVLFTLFFAEIVFSSFSLIGMLMADVKIVQEKTTILLNVLLLRNCSDSKNLKCTGDMWCDQYTFLLAFSKWCEQLDITYWTWGKVFENDIIIRIRHFAVHNCSFTIMTVQ